MDKDGNRWKPFFKISQIWDKDGNINLKISQLWTHVATEGEACCYMPTFGQNYLELFWTKLFGIDRLINLVQHFLRPTVATYVFQIQWKKPKDIFDLLKSNLNIGVLRGMSFLAY